MAENCSFGKASDETCPQETPDGSFWGTDPDGSHVSFRLREGEPLAPPRTTSPHQSGVVANPTAASTGVPTSPSTNPTLGTGIGPKEKAGKSHNCISPSSVQPTKRAGRGGRPKAAKDSKRAVRLKLNLTVKEARFIQTYCEETGEWSVSAWARNALLSHIAGNPATAVKWSTAEMEVMKSLDFHLKRLAKLADYTSQYANRIDTRLFMVKNERTAFLDRISKVVNSEILNEIEIELDPLEARLEIIENEMKNRYNEYLAAYQEAAKELIKFIGGKL